VQKILNAQAEFRKNRLLTFWTAYTSRLYFESLEHIKSYLSADKNLDNVFFSGTFFFFWQEVSTAFTNLVQNKSLASKKHRSMFVVISLNAHFTTQNEPVEKQFSAATIDRLRLMSLLSVFSWRENTWSVSYKCIALTMYSRQIICQSCALLLTNTV